MNNEAERFGHFASIVAHLEVRSRLFFTFSLCLSLFLIGCAPTLKQVGVAGPEVQMERERQREIAFSAYVKRQERLFTVTYPLLASAAAMKPTDAQPVCGFMYHNKKLYGKDYEEVAARYFKIGDQLVIRYVHPGFPAAAAGMKDGDQIVGVNGQSLIGKQSDEVRTLLKERSSKSDGQITICVERGGQVMDISMTAVPSLKYEVLLRIDDSINAFADGNRIVFTTGLMRLAETDEELALVVAHEIAHNVLGHREKKVGNAMIGAVFDVLVAGTLKVNTQGTFSKVGAAAFSKEFEAEADYAGLYIAARAGYDIGNAANFWRRIAAEHPKSIEQNYAASHPSTPERYLAIEKAVAEIKEKQQLGLPLLPEKK